jgi:hypothetical protein
MNKRRDTNVYVVTGSATTTSHDVEASGLYFDCVMTLALGIGSRTAIFVVDAAVIRGSLQFLE